jgi:proline iminopeptidase
MARAEPIRITTDGATLALRHFPGSGDPIVLLHGGPGMGDYFGSFPEVLSPPYSVVSYNQRGCGPSSCDGSFDVAKHVADLDAIRRHFAAEQIHLFGHS